MNRQKWWGILGALAAAGAQAEPTAGQQLAAGESYPAFYRSLDRIVLKDAMTQFFNVNDKGIMSYGLEDAAKASGNLCPAVTGAFLMTQAGLKALADSYRKHPAEEVSSYNAKDRVLYRGGIKITMSGKGDTGGPEDSMANAMSYITGAKAAAGFSHGPNFPFANRRNLLHHDPALKFDPAHGIEAIFTSMIATYHKKDGSKATFQECEHTWGQCVETTRCDRSFKVTYHFKSPDIVGNDPKITWDKKIKNIIDHRDRAITVEPVENPAAACADKG